MVCSKADTTFDTKLISTSPGVELVIALRKSSRRALTRGLLIGAVLSSIAHTPTVCAAEQANNLAGEVQQNFFDSEQDRNQFLLDLALKSPDKGAKHILVHENVSHTSGDNKDRALAASIAAPSISNFDIVSEGLWRGAAPSNQAMQKLAESGVKTIVDLRLAGLGAEEEANRAKKLGIKYIHIPLGFMGPSLSKVAQFLNIVNDPANQPVFVHCRYGADRTGALVGVFRVIHDHWSFNQAYSEMRSHHFKPWLATLKRVVARVGGNAEVQQELKTLANKNLASTNL